MIEHRFEPTHDDQRKVIGLKAIVKGIKDGEEYEREKECSETSD